MDVNGSVRSTEVYDLRVYRGDTGNQGTVCSNMYVHTYVRIWPLVQNFGSIGHYRDVRSL
jgi:hypothetical protein